MPQQLETQLIVLRLPCFQKKKAIKLNNQNLFRNMLLLAIAKILKSAKAELKFRT